MVYVGKMAEKQQKKINLKCISLKRWESLRLVMKSKHIRRLGPQETILLGSMIILKERWDLNYSEIFHPALMLILFLNTSTIPQ